MKLPLKLNWRSPKFWVLFAVANIALSPTVWAVVLYAIAMPAKAETTTITTTEKETPIVCTREGKMMTCSTTKITAVTTTITAPAPKRREKEDGNV